MKAFGFLSLFLLVGTSAFICHGFSRKGNTIPNSGMVRLDLSDALTSSLKIRKLKDVAPPISDEKDDGHVNLEDYRPIDPVPSAKAYIRPGPIQHGTPLNPYVPQPSPPPT